MTLYHVKMYFSTDMIPSVALGFYSVIVVGDNVLLLVWIKLVIVKDDSLCLNMFAHRMIIKRKYVQLNWVRKSNDSTITNDRWYSYKCWYINQLTEGSNKPVVTCCCYAISISPVWCCAHSAQRWHLFLFASINGKKPPRLLLATRYTRRKQQPLPRHGGLSVRGACCRCVVQRPGHGSPHTAARWGAATPQKEARWLQIRQDTGRGLLFNGNALRHWISPDRYCDMLLFC